MLKVISAIATMGVLALSSMAEDRVRPIKRFAPDYPEQAYEAEVPGKVSALLHVNADGDVERVEIVSESPKGFLFAAAATEAFKKWKYPKDVPGAYSATFNFEAAPLPLTPEERALDFSTPPIDREKPSYPREAEDEQVPGDALIVAIVGTDGRVSSARIAAETPPGYRFGEAALSAVLQYVFAPAAKPSTWTVTVRFRFHNTPDVPSVALPQDLPMAPEPSRRETPVYPAKALEARVEGTVDIGIQIDGRGDITHAGVLSETPPDYDFAGNAYKSLTGWRFVGTPPGTYRLRIEFKLDDPD